MPSPFDIFGGLAQVGGAGAGGAFQGLVQGEELRRMLQSREIQDQFRMMQMQLTGQDIQRGRQPTYQVQGGRLIATPPVGPPTISNLTPTPTEAATLEEKQLVTRGTRLQTEISEKIARGEPLTSGEQSYARAAGLTKAPTLTEEEADVLAKYRRGERLSSQEQDILDAYLMKLRGRPSASEKTILNWLAAQKPPLADTPSNREVARQALMKEREQSQVRVATDVAKLQADVARRAGGEATKEISKIQHQAGLLDQSEDMADSMEAVIRRLAKFSGNAATFNWIRQQLAAKGGVGPHAKEIGDALAAVQAANARYAAIAQGVEGVTGNRLALQLAERMRAMHVHEEEPLSRNLERLTQLRSTIKQLRLQINKHAQDVIRRQQESMEAVGKPGTPLSVYGGAASRAGTSGEQDQDLGDEP
jgi:hypothetical protein